MVCRTLNLFFEHHFFAGPPPTMPPPMNISVRQLMWFYFESGKDDKHILDVTEISVRQLRKMRRNWEEFGEVVRHIGQSSIMHESEE